MMASQRHGPPLPPQDWSALQDQSAGSARHVSSVPLIGPMSSSVAPMMYGVTASSTEHRASATIASSPRSATNRANASAASAATASASRRRADADLREKSPIRFLPVGER